MKQKTQQLRAAFDLRAGQLPDWMRTALLLILATLFSALTYHLSHAKEDVVILYILMVVVVSSITTGYWWGVFSAAASVLLTDFFFTPPYLTLHISPSASPLTFVIMLAAALASTALTARIKERARLSICREQRTKLLYELTKKLLATRGLDNIVDTTSEYIQNVFHCEVSFYTAPIDEDGVCTLLPAKDAPPLAGEDLAAAELSVQNQVVSGAGAGTHPGATRFYMPIVSQGHTYGVVGLTSGDDSAVGEGDVTFLDMIIAQVAMALERQHLSDEQRKIIIESEKEKMRSNLLRAISHDLRTPLTGILGASSAILENGSKLTPAAHDRLITDIREDSQWLIRMVENLLSVTRMRDSETSVTKSPEAVEEIISEAVSRIRTRFPGYKIEVRVPDELMMVPMDGTLIEQVLINLVENAIKYSGTDTPVSVSASQEADWAVFAIADQGEGISPEALPFLFDGYASRPNVSSDSSRGMGIGLSICNSIVKAHGGTISAKNKPEGGALFIFRLPMQEDCHAQ